jgi:hypothetical protein
MRTTRSLDTKPLETVLDAMIARITLASTGTAASSLGRHPSPSAR